MNTSTIVNDAILDHVSVIQRLQTLIPVIQRIAAQMIETVTSGGKVIWCGNGGSAADAQHLAAELVGRFKRERCALPSIAITTDTSVLTAIGNDYGFEHIFSRQIQALCRAGDLVVGISTSGNSNNICTAFRAAIQVGATTVAMTGENGGVAAQIANIALRVPSSETARIQEAHILCGHIVCDLVELSLADPKFTKEGAARA